MLERERERERCIPWIFVQKELVNMVVTELVVVNTYIDRCTRDIILGKNAGMMSRA